MDASIPSKLLTPRILGRKPKMGVRNNELVSALHSHCRGHRFDSGMLHTLQSLEITGFQGFFVAFLFLLFCNANPLLECANLYDN